MAFRDRIEVVVDFVTTPAKKGMTSLKADVAAADGALGKTKAGVKNLAGSLSAYAAPAALAAGSALVAFGTKSVKAFTDGALAAGKMADATGLTSEEASRLAEVGSDVGVGMDTLTSAVRRVNAAAESGALKQFGIEAVRTADGQLNVNETFLATVDALSKITDAGAREAAARKLLGKGWSEVSELVAAGADDMREKLAAVSDAQVFDREEVNKARDFRAAMDELSDATQKVMMTVGEGLTPAITDLAEGVGSLSDALGGGSGGGAIGSVLDFINPLDNVTESFRDLTDGTVSFGDKARAVGSLIPGVGEALDRFTDNNERLDGVLGFVTEGMADQKTKADELERQMITTAESTDIAATSADNLRTSLEELIGGERDAIAARRESDESTRAYNEALATLGGTLLDTEATTGDVEQATRDASDAALKASEDFAIMEAGSLDSAEGVRSQIESLQGMRDELDPGSPLRRNIQGHIDALKAIERSITTTVSVTYLNNGNGPTVDENGNVRAGRRAGGAGTPNALGDSALWAQAMSADLAGNAAKPSGPSAQERQQAGALERVRVAEAQYKLASKAARKSTARRFLAVLLDARKKFDAWSVTWVTLTEKIRGVRADLAEMDKGDTDAHSGDGGNGGHGTGMGGRSAGGVAGRSAGGGVSITLNAPHAKVIHPRFFDEFAENIDQALRRYERGQG